MRATTTFLGPHGTWGQSWEHGTDHRGTVPVHEGCASRSEHTPDVTPIIRGYCPRGSSSSLTVLGFLRGVRVLVAVRRLTLLRRRVCGLRVLGPAGGRRDRVFQDEDKALA